MHQIEQRARHRAGRLGEIDQSVDGLGQLGGAARAVAHHAVDEAWIGCAAAHDPGQRRIKRPRPRPLGIGGVENDEIGLAPERSGRRGEAADMGGILGAFQQIARGIVAAMQQQIGCGDLGGERARQRRAFALGAAITMRGGGEIGGADRRSVSLLAEQILDAGAIGAGRRAEDAGESRAAHCCAPQRRADSPRRPRRAPPPA